MAASEGMMNIKKMLKVCVNQNMALPEKLITNPNPPKRNVHSTQTTRETSTEHITNST